MWFANTKCNDNDTINHDYNVNDNDENNNSNDYNYYHNYDHENIKSAAMDEFISEQQHFFNSIPCSTSNQLFQDWRSMIKFAAQG